MVLIEMRESIMNDMIEELSEAKKSLHKTKSALCNIEDLIDEMYSGESTSDEEYDEYESMPEDGGEYTGEIEVSYKNSKMHNMRNMRNMRNMWRKARKNSRMNRRGYGLYSY